ncbi:MAG: ribosome maturation factor RimP [Bacillota bacterium]
MEEREAQRDPNPVLKTIENLAAKAVKQIGLELVDVEWKTSEGKPLIVVYIDSDEGISLEHCQKVSKSLGDLLDREDPLPSSYYLEVSSPGIERRLKKESDFERFVGKDIKVKTFNKINDSRNFRGVIKGFSENTLTMLLENGEELKINIADIARANLWYKQAPRR